MRKNRETEIPVNFHWRPDGGLSLVVTEKGVEALILQFLASRGPDYFDFLNQRRNLSRSRTKLGSLEQTVEETLTSRWAAESGLWEFLQRHRSFRTKEAMQAWAGEEVSPLAPDGEPNPQYHVVWARVQSLIDQYAEKKGLYYRTKRIGKGTAYEFLTPDEARTFGYDVTVDPKGRRRLRK